MIKKYLLFLILIPVFIFAQSLPQEKIRSSGSGVKSGSPKSIFALPTTSTLTSAPNPSDLFESVVFRDTITGLPDGGTVQFKDGGVNIGAPVFVDSYGMAVYSTSNLNAGTHTVTAEYSGTINYEPSISNQIIQIVNKATTTSILSSSSNPSGLFENVIFRDTITGLPDGGTVQFKDGGMNIGTPVPVDGSGIALFTTSNFSAGTHTVTAEYSGTINYEPSISNSIIQIVNKATTTSILTSSLNPSMFEQTITLKDSVTGPPDGGTVQFKDGGVSIGTPVSINPAGVATITISALSVGSHSITSEYSGTTNFEPSISNIVDQVVTKKTTTSILTSSLNPSMFEQTITLKDSVTGPPDGGTVQFKDGGVNIGTPVPISVAGIATMTISALSVGTHSITAEYSGTTNFEPSISNIVDQVVNKKITTSILTSSLNPSIYEQTITLKDSVTGSPDGGTVQFKVGGVNIGTPISISAAGVATITISTLSVGTHSITAEYNGTSNFEPSISNIVAQVVNKKTTTSILTSSVNSSTFGQLVTLKDSVTGLPDGGTVQFKDGVSNLGLPVPVDVNGVATLATANLSAGEHSITAEFSGTANYELSTSNILTLFVNRIVTSSILSSSSNPSDLFETVIFRDSVIGEPDGGVVQFKDGGLNIGLPVSIDINGVAIYTTAGFNAGIHNITAEYSGTTNYEPSISNIVVQMVNKEVTTSLLSTSLNPSIYGQVVTVKDSVTGSPDGGTVQFKDGGVNIGAPVLINGNGVALYSTSNLTAGIHTITAEYNGTGNYEASTSNVISQLVNKRASTSILISSLNPSGYNQLVIFRDSVLGALPDGGTVQFKDGGVNLSAPVTLNSNGVAILMIPTLNVGTHTITAEYSGSANIEPSISNLVSQVVTNEITTSTLTSSLNPSAYGDAITFKDSVSGFPDGGTVVFKDGAISLGSPVAVNTAGVATLTLSTFAAGTHTITAEYSGTSNFGASISNSVIQVVNRKVTLTRLTSSLNPTIYGQSITFMDSVYNTTPDGGTVQFRDEGVNLGTPIPVNANGVASMTISTLSAGSHNISAFYSGTSNFASSNSNTVTEIVNRRSTTSILISTPNPSVYGQPVTLRDSVTGMPDGGTVQFRDGGVNIGAPVAVNANGVAVLNISTLGTGSHVLTAVYSGTINFSASTSNAVTEVINRRTTTSILTSSLNPSTYGQAVTFKDSVTGSPDGGTVQFRNGTVNLGGQVAINANGVATLTISTLSIATHSITAVYSGTANVTGSTSNTVTQTVNKRSTTSTLVSSSNPSMFGQAVTFKDSIYNSTPDGGTVQFKDGGVNLGLPVTVNTRGVASISVMSLSIGSHVISAEYSGTNNFDPSVSNPITQIVTKKRTVSLLTASASSINSGQLLILRDSVIGSLPDGGTVQFKDRSEDLGIPVSLNQNGVAYYSTSTLDTGTHAFTAVYGGSVNNDSSISNIKYVTVGDTSLYRSFTADSIALSRDNRGEYGKLVKRKPVRVEFAFTVTNDSDNVSGLHVELGISIDPDRPFSTTPTSEKLRLDPARRVWNFVFSSPLAAGTEVIVHGFGAKGSYQKVLKYFWMRGNAQIGRSEKNPPFIDNSLKLPMPNRVNVIAEEFFQFGFDPLNGLIIGRNKKIPVDSSRYYGWLQSTQYTDIVKTLYNMKYGLRQTGHPKGFDVDKNGIPLVGQKRNLKPEKYNNRLLADMIALKVNIIASAMKKTPLGFGELVFDDPDDMFNPYNGMMVREIAAAGDSLMMGYYSGRSHYFFSRSVYNKLDSTIEKINTAFEGKLDTLSFGNSLVLKGTYSLADRPFMRKNPNVIPLEIVPIGNMTDEIPMLYYLDQNYPNPFNPATTIRFEIPVVSLVTLKIYNLLGQEIATLTDRQIMDEGIQEIDFDAQSLASGVYIYRIVAEELVDEETGTRGYMFTGAKKMLLLK